MAIEPEVLQFPAAAIEHPRYATPEGVREYLEEFDYWTFGRSADEILRAARVGKTLAFRIENEIEAESGKVGADQGLPGELDDRPNSARL